MEIGAGGGKHSHSKYILPARHLGSFEEGIRFFFERCRIAGESAPYCRFVYGKLPNQVLLRLAFTIEFFIPLDANAMAS